MKPQPRFRPGDRVRYTDWSGLMPIWRGWLGTIVRRYPNETAIVFDQRPTQSYRVNPDELEFVVLPRRARPYSVGRLAP